MGKVSSSLGNCVDFQEMNCRIPECVLAGVGEPPELHQTAEPEASEEHLLLFTSRNPLIFRFSG